MASAKGDSTSWLSTLVVPGSSTPSRTASGCPLETWSCPGRSLAATGTCRQPRCCLSWQRCRGLRRGVAWASPSAPGSQSRWPPLEDPRNEPSLVGERLLVGQHLEQEGFLGRDAIQQHHSV